MARREFSTAVRVEIIKRATRNGITFCEACGIMAKRPEVDHIKADGLEVDKSGRLTALDGRVLCAGFPGSCHSIKTSADDEAIARAKRRQAAFIGAKPPPAKPIQSPGFKSRKPKRAERPRVVGSSGLARQYGIET